MVADAAWILQEEMIGRVRIQASAPSFFLFPFLHTRTDRHKHACAHTRMQTCRRGRVDTSRLPNIMSVELRHAVD